MLEFSGIDEVALYGLWMFKAGELSSLDFKAFFVLRPLVELSGRNGGLGLKCRWEGF